MGSMVLFLSLLPEDEQREKSVSHQTVQQLVLEKEQALADLNSVEKSLADLFRRYEKMKEVLEGFRKVRLCSGRVGREGADQAGSGGGVSGRPSLQAGESDLVIREFSGSPALVGISSVGSTPVLCCVRMKRC